MRIIHLIDYFQPAIGYQEVFLAREHSEAGHDVFVVTSDRFHPYLYSGNAAPVMGKRTKGTGFFLESSVQVWRLKTAFEFPNIIWLRGLEKKVKEINPDLIVVHGITNTSAVRIAWMKNRDDNFKLIYDDHVTLHNSGGKMKILYPVFKWTLSKMIQKAADGLVAILPATKDFMQTTYGIPSGHIDVIPLGADTTLFHYDPAARRDIRKKFRIGEKDIVYSYISKIIPVRQVLVFIQAFSKLAEKYDNLKVLFVGSGEPDYVNMLKMEVESNGLQDKFFWQDAVPNELVYKYYSASDVSVWPFGASIGMREAMACGLPIVIGEESLVTELVEGDNGYTFHEGDFVDLADKMEKLLDSELRVAMGKNSRRLVEEKFNWKTIADQFLEIVE